MLTKQLQRTVTMALIVCQVTPLFAQDKGSISIKDDSALVCTLLRDKWECHAATEDEAKARAIEQQVALASVEDVMQVKEWIAQSEARIIAAINEPSWFTKMLESRIFQTIVAVVGALVVRELAKGGPPDPTK